MTNCIVYNHQNINVTTNPIQNIVYSDIEGNYPGDGNIGLLPQFVDKHNLDYQLVYDSPCKNAGVDIGITDDCIGTTRPQLDSYDMGAYEFVPEPGVFGAVISYLLLVLGIRRKFNFSF
jgi:hypothetical protein